ncbi:hypothetical protein CRUP_038843 [Coryphaenoides rupestris]|nr:hypothetical protein CRUP_038843 [Coryphaenoides rupestris]
MFSWGEVDLTSPSDVVQDGEPEDALHQFTPATRPVITQLSASRSVDFQFVLAQREKGTGHGHGHREVFTVVAPDQHPQQLNQHVVNPQALGANRLPTQRRQETVSDDDLHLASADKHHQTSARCSGLDVDLLTTAFDKLETRPKVLLKPVGVESLRVYYVLVQLLQVLIRSNHGEHLSVAVAVAGAFLSLRQDKLEVLVQKDTFHILRMSTDDPKYPLKLTGDGFFILGTIFGMALYNECLMNIPFPLALFKKLLDVKPSLDDLQELSPTVAQSLKKLLEYEEESAFKDLDLDFGWQLMTALKGEEIFNWDNLRQNAQYQGCTPEDEVVKSFWTVFAEFSVEQKEDFLIFLTGMDRIPKVLSSTITITIKLSSYPDPEVYYPGGVVFTFGGGGCGQLGHNSLGNELRPRVVAELRSIHVVVEKKASWETGSPQPAWYRYLFCSLMVKDTFHILRTSTHDPESPLKLTGDGFFILGTIFGMALYNECLMNIPFPLALFKKLLDVKPSLDDLQELSPTVAQSLKKLLEYEEESAFKDLDLDFGWYSSLGMDRIPKVRSFDNHDYDQVVVVPRP